MRSWPWSFVAAALLALAVGAAVPAATHAQQQEECEGIPHCGPYNEDPGEGCNGPNDPFCEGGGGGGGSNAGCAVCLFIHEGPNGEPAYYFCADIAGQRLNDCEAIGNGCTSNGYCVWV